MIDVSRITSGYDVELVLGDTFFGTILRALIESGAVATTWSRAYAGYSLSLEIIPDYDVAISPAPDPFYGPAIVRTGFQLRGTTPKGSFLTPTITVGVAFAFSGVPGADGLIRAIALNVAFWDLQVDWQMLIPPVQREFSEAIRGAFGDMLSAEVETGLSGGAMQAFASRCYGATGSHTGAVGLYFNLPLVQEPDGTLFEARGDISAAKCILPAKTQSMAVAINGSVYGMLARHLKNDYAYQMEDGSYSFAIYRDQKYRIMRLGTLKSVDVRPRVGVLTMGDMLDPSSWDENAVFTICLVRVIKGGIEGDLTFSVRIGPELEDGQLGFSATVDYVDLDLDWEYDLAAAVILAGIMGFIASISGGFLGLGLAANVYGTLATSAKEAGLSYAEGLVRSGIQEELDAQVAPFRVIPGCVTVVPRRFDPFYVTHYQVASTFDSCDVLLEAITATGRQDGVVTTDVPYQDVIVIDYVRNEDGAIVELLYQVGEPEGILEPERCRQPAGAPPDQFLLTVDEAVERKNNGQLRPIPYATPTHVCRRHNKIQLIKFDTGLELTPDEAGQLELASLLYVVGYKRVYVKRTGRFYYRAKQDPFPGNNLSQLPRFTPDREE